MIHFYVIPMEPDISRFSVTIDILKYNLHYEQSNFASILAICQEIVLQPICNDPGQQPTSSINHTQK